MSWILTSGYPTDRSLVGRTEAVTLHMTEEYFRRIHTYVCVYKQKHCFRQDITNSIPSKWTEKNHQTFKKGTFAFNHLKHGRCFKASHRRGIVAKLPILFKILENLWIIYVIASPCQKREAKIQKASSAINPL